MPPDPLDSDHKMSVINNPAQNTSSITIVLAPPPPPFDENPKWNPGKYTTLYVPT